MAMPAQLETDFIRRSHPDPNMDQDDSAFLSRSRCLRPLMVPGLLVVLGIAALTIDLPLAIWMRKEFPEGLKKMCDLAEVFGHGLGVAAVMVTVWIVAPHLRPKLPRVMVSAYFSGLVALSFKLFVARTRPNRAMFESVTNVADTFRGWFPWFSTGTGLQSVPSGHCATAVGLAIGLAWLFPRGKWLFAFFALLVAAQRMAGGYHFLSDTLWGAAVGWLCANACMPGRLLSPPLDRLERQLSSG